MSLRERNVWRAAFYTEPMEADRLIQGMAEGGDFRIIAAQTTEMVETARQLLDLAPVATDALGNLCDDLLALHAKPDA